MGDEATLRLTAVLGVEAAETLQSRACSRNRQVDLAEPRWTAEGYTERGSPQWSSARCRHHRRGRASTSSRSVPRTAGGAKARAITPPWSSLRPALPSATWSPWAGEPVLLPDGGELLPQEIAGASLTRCRPMSEYSAEDRARTAAALAQALTREWTRRARLAAGDTDGCPGLLRTGLDGAPPLGKATSTLPQALGIDAALLSPDAELDRDARGRPGHTAG